MSMSKHHLPCDFPTLTLTQVTPKRFFYERLSRFHVCLAPGLAFLLCFLVWGWKCRPNTGCGAPRRVDQASCAGLWAFVSTASAFLFIAELFLQLLYSAHLVQPPAQPPPALGPSSGSLWHWCWSWGVLILGLGPAAQGGLLDVLQLLLPPLLCLLASVAEGQRCRDELDLPAAQLRVQAPGTGAEAGLGPVGQQCSEAVAGGHGVRGRQGSGPRAEPDTGGEGEGGGGGGGARECVVQPGQAEHASTASVGWGQGGFQAQEFVQKPSQPTPWGSDLAGFNAAATTTWPLLLPLPTHAGSSAAERAGLADRAGHSYSPLVPPGPLQPRAGPPQDEPPGSLPPPPVLDMLRLGGGAFGAAAALLWPSAASMPYMGCVAVGVHAWSRARGRGATWAGAWDAGGRLLQAYVALHVLLLYAVQASRAQGRG